MIRSSFLAVLLSTSYAMADAPRVVTDFAPVHSLVAQVMEGVSTPDILLPQGADPHSFQMRPSQARNLAQAELVFWVGPELTPWLERALEGLSEATAVQLLDVPGTKLRESDHVHGHEAEEDHDEHETHDGEHETHDEDHDTHDEEHDEDHNHDPHAWLSPDNAIVWLSAIAENLANADPENAATYRANADRARSQLMQLNDELVAQLAPVKDNGFVVFHDAYGYLVEQYGLNQQGSVRESDSATPSAARLKELQDLLTSGDVVCVFSEVVEGGEFMETLVESNGISTGVLDPAGSALPVGPELYEQMMRAMADEFLGCLSGKDQ